MDWATMYGRFTSTSPKAAYLEDCRFFGPLHFLFQRGCLVIGRNMVGSASRILWANKTWPSVVYKTLIIKVQNCLSKLSCFVWSL
jgi:hypothetical protein